MDIKLFLLLFLHVGWCSTEENFEIKTVDVGENLTLSCNRHVSRGIATFFWIRLVPGNLPEVLGKAFSFDSNSLSRNSHDKIKDEPGSITLHIQKTKLSDSAFYYCLRLQQFNVTFVKGTFVRIKEPEPDFTAVNQYSPSAAVIAGDSVTLQCSVFSERKQKRCSEGCKVFWFRITSEKSHPRLILGQSESDGECDTSPEAQAVQECVYSLSKDNVSSSDAGAYFCAAAACGKIIFGNGTKLEVFSTNDTEKNDTLIFLLSGALAVSVIITALLSCVVIKKSCNCGKVSESLETNAERVCNEQQNQQRNQSSLIYSTVTVTRGDAGRAGRKKMTKKETIYNDIKCY